MTWFGDMSHRLPAALAFVRLVGRLTLSKVRYNYGLYTNILDRLFGTLHPETFPVYERLTDAPPPSVAWTPGADSPAAERSTTPAGESLRVFITGATGFLGKATLAHLVDQRRYERLYVLIRAEDDETVQRRLKTLVAELLGPAADALAAQKLVAIRGDLALPGLGLSPADRHLLVRDTDGILHIGASTDFGATLAVSRQMNVEGTRAVLDLALEARAVGRLARFDYVSTAFVSGTMAGLITEHDLERGQTFANNYERSKFEAEALVRKAAALPTAIYRPSIVVGDSQTGYTPHFKVLYWPLRLLSLRSIPIAFLNKRIRLDVVPVDYVVRAMVALLERPSSVGGCYHLTAGLGHEVSAQRILQGSKRYIDARQVPIFPFWVRNVWRGTWLRRLLPEQFWEISALAAPYDDYFKGSRVRFDSRATDAVLIGLGIDRPSWRDYEAGVLSYCRTSRWGRKTPQPVHSYYQHYRRLDEAGPASAARHGEGQRNAGI